MVNYLSVDAEAAEVEIFRKFPFDEFDIQVVSVEIQVRNYYELDVTFFNAGYAKVAVLGGDHVYAKMPWKPDLPVGAEAWHESLEKDFYAHAQPRSAALGGTGVR